MKQCLTFFGGALLLASSLFSQEQANVKIALNSKVTYDMDLKIDAKQNLPEGEAEIVYLDSEQKFDLNVIKDKEMPLLVITPRTSWFKLTAGAFTMNYDSEDLEDGVKDQFWKKLTKINNEPVKIPLTTDRAFLTKANKEYPILPIVDVDSYLQAVEPILGLIQEGLIFDKGNALKFDNEYQGGAFHAKSDVTKISDSEVVIESSINWSGKEALDDPKADLIHKGDGKATITIDRSNLLVTNVEAEIVVRLSNHSANKANAIPILSDGEVVAKINLNITPKKWDKD